MKTGSLWQTASYGGTFSTKAPLSPEGFVKRRTVRPDWAPYKVKERPEQERQAAQPHYKYAIYDRYELAVLLFTSIAQAQHVCEHININMAKEVMK